MTQTAEVFIKKAADGLLTIFEILTFYFKRFKYRISKNVTGTDGQQIKGRTHSRSEPLNYFKYLP